MHNFIGQPFVELTDDSGKVVRRMGVTAYSGGTQAPSRLTLLIEDISENGVSKLAFSTYALGASHPLINDHSLPFPNFGFGLALSYLQSEHPIARQSEAWCAKHRFLYLVPGSTFTQPRLPLYKFVARDSEVQYRPHVDVCYEDGTFGVYTFTQDDILATDWRLMSHDGQPI